jgi:signal peptidase I
MNFSKIIYNIFVVATVMVALAVILPLLPIKGNYKIMAVLSGSMEPSIKTGGVVFVKPEPDYHAGDVISFSVAAGNKVSTTHRIVEVKTEGGKTTYITKGDANSEADNGEVDKRNVVGKVIFALPYAGYLLAFIRQPMGFIAAVVIPSSLVIFDEGQNIFKELRGGQNDYHFLKRVRVRRALHIVKVYKIKVKEIL